MQAISVICTLPCTYALTVNTPAGTAHPKQSNHPDKRSLLIGDLSYSYSATDIGSNEGSHVKTITVIKNVGAPKYDKAPPHHHHHSFDEWDDSLKNRFNFVFKFPEIPQIDSGTFFYTEKPRKVIPTKQPTDRQTPVINTEFDTNDFDDQPDVNVNMNGNVPPVSEKSPDSFPDIMSMMTTENPVTKEASDEVEYIQTDGEKSKSMMPTPAMFNSKKMHSTRTRHGYRISNGHGKTTEKKQSQEQRQTPDFIEDFSDDSMHNVKHLVDPMKVKDSLLKYTQNQSNLDLKKLTNVESNSKDKKYDSYGNVVHKAQSLMDTNQPYKNDHDSNVPTGKQRPYISPSLKNIYSSPSPSPTIATTVAPTTSKGLSFLSTTQKPYVAPKKSKLSEKLNPEKSFNKPSTERIVQPMLYSLQLNNDNGEQVSDQMIKIEYQPSQPIYQQRENYKTSVKQFHEQPKPDPMKFHSYSIRNPLTTSLPVQHNQQEMKSQSYMAVPIDADLPSLSNGQFLKPLPKRYVRHHIVFDSKPPHSFMESPFEPVKSMLMG